MATIEDILKKDKQGQDKESKGEFVPQEKRAWDYVDKNKKKYNSKKQNNAKSLNGSNDKNEMNRTIKLLCGHQQKIMVLITNHIAKTGEKEKIALSIIEIAEKLNTSKVIIRTAIKRLIAKGIINRLKGKRGRLGITLIRIDKDIANLLMQNFSKE